MKEIINNPFVEDIKVLIRQSKKKAYSTINTTMIEAYWNIGQRIVLEEQNNNKRANYGDKIIEDLSKELTKEFGQGFSTTNLKSFRTFYLVFRISHAVSDQLGKKDKKQVVISNNSLYFMRQELSWTHYRLIMRVKNSQARNFYIQEAANEGWSTRNLERNINSLYYERILSSKDKKLISTEETQESLSATKPNIRDFIKDPFILEFLDLPSNLSYQEKELEEALILHLQKFLLELGKGFAFLARQQHIKTENSDFYIDLVFYNYILKCFVLIDLKAGKLTHQDIGQIDMYVRMYDDLKKAADDNPTIGLILCTETDSVVVKYSVLKENEQLFASQYCAILPSEEELKQEIEREIRVFENNIYLKNKEQN